MKKIIYLIIIIISLVSILHGCGKRKNPDPVVLDLSQEAYGDVDLQGLRSSLGEILSVTQNGSIVVIKTKITENWNSEMTVTQNYDIVKNLIIKNGFNTCQEIQYWAVMDLNGNEMKVVSFDLDKATIDGIYSEKIYGSMIEDYAKNLWIAPALK